MLRGARLGLATLRLNVARQVLNSKVPFKFQCPRGELEAALKSARPLREGPIPDELGQCGELEALSLSDNQLSGGVPASLGNCANLKTLQLFKNQLEGPIPDEPGQCGELEALDLRQNQLTGCVPASLDKCT
eukprot:scaffold28342_cov57-Phaeocystis_antarctica.AAC.2